MPSFHLRKVNTDTPRTAFGEQLAAELHPIFQGTFEYTVDNTELNTNVIVNGGTVTQGSGMAVVRTSTTTGSTACLTSRRHARYRAGIGGNIRFTALFTAPVAGTEQLHGLVDEEGGSESFVNGYTIGYIGTVFGFHRFQNDVLISVPIASWDDPLDGTGATGVTLDQTKLGVWSIQFQYLGAGNINILFEDPKTGVLTIVHRVQYPNNNIVPSVFNPNFHFTMWVANKATTADLIVKTGSYVYFTEGKTEFTEIHQPQFSSELIQKTGVTTEVPIFTIRNKSTYASKTNFIDIILEGVGASIEAAAANNLGSIRVVRNGTLGGTPVYSDINTSNSVVEIDTSAISLTGGKTIAPGVLAGKNDAISRNILNLKIILQAGETITVMGISANSATINAFLLWKELF